MTHILPIFDFFFIYLICLLICWHLYYSLIVKSNMNEMRCIQILKLLCSHHLCGFPKKLLNIKLQKIEKLIGIQDIYCIYLTKNSLISNERLRNNNVLIIVI